MEKTKKTFIVLLLVGAFALSFFLLATTAQASIIAYDNLGPDDTYANVGSHIGDYFFGGPHYSSYGRFTSSATGPVDHMVLALTDRYAYYDHEITLAMLEDDAGSLGNVLWTETFFVELYDRPSLFKRDVTGPQLVTGMSYWLGVDSPSAIHLSENAYWWVNNKGVMDFLIQKEDNKIKFHEYGLAYGMRITVTPEPSTLLLLGSGLIGLVVVRRKLRRKP